MDNAHHLCEDLSLDGVEFSSLPSGLHLVDEDVVQVIPIVSSLINNLTIIVSAGISHTKFIMEYLSSGGDLQVK